MKRKIAFISEHASPLAALGGVDSGGQNIYVGELARHLSFLGYEVDIFTRHDDERLPQTVEWVKGVRVVHVKAGPVEYIPKEKLLPYMGEFADGVVAFSKGENNPYKLVHANFWMSGLVAAELKARMGLPYVVTFHALGKVRRQYQKEQDHFPEERFAVEERVVQEADRIIALCPQDHKDLERLYAADPRKMIVIPGGFSRTEMYPIDKLLARMVLDLDPNRQVILQLGRMVPRKGVDTLIVALGHLKHTDAVTPQLIIVGGESDIPDPQLTPEIARLQQLAEVEGVSDQVVFVGRKGRESLKYYYSAADVFVTTPWYEPFGITPLEAMACGTPVIASAVGGLKSTIEDGTSGSLVPAQDPAALGEKLSELLRSSKLRQYYRENGLKRVNQYTWNKVANSMASVYEQVLFALQVESRQYDDPLHRIDQGFTELSATLERSRQSLRVAVLDTARALVSCFARGGKVLVCGNGGSAADGQHFAAELLGRFQLANRRALPVISLNADGAFLTAWGNDVSFAEIFSRQIEGLGQAADVLIGFTTSGRSVNVNEAFKVARAKGMLCIGLLGKGGGEAAHLVDIAVTVPSHTTARIQEVQQYLVHSICELVEQELAFTEVARAVPTTLVREPVLVPQRTMRRGRRK